MRVRPVTAADQPHVLRMVRALYAEDPSPRSPSDGDVERTLGVLADASRGAALVADDGGGAPFAYVFLTRLWSNELGGDIVFIDELWVAPERRGCGVGTAVIAHAMRTMAERGAVAFELEVTPGNARARALYERLGFRPLRNASLRLVVDR
jgi:ribosomal protein S18 acetylase RimI-like enzyme